MTAAMRFTTFQSVKDNVPVTYEGWKKFHELFQLKIVDDKAAVLLYCPAEFVNKRRLDCNVSQINFGAIDVDDHDENAVMDALNELAELDLQVILHTTHSHAKALPEKYKCRVIIPFSRPVEVDEWDRVWHGLNELVGHIADEKCKNPNRIYYFPSCPPGAEDLAVVEHINPDGEVLDIDEFIKDLDEAAPKTSFIKKVDPEKLNRISADIRFKLAEAFLEQKFPPVGEGDRNATTFRVSMTCGDFGLDIESAWPLVMDWNSRCDPPLDDDELERTHASAYKKDSARRLPFGWRLFDHAQGDAVEATHLQKLADKHSKKPGRFGTVGRWLQKIMKGDPIGTEAEQIFESVAELLAREFTNASPVQLTVLMEESIKKTHDAGNRDITIEWMTHRIEQAQDELQVQRAENQLDLKLLERLTIKDAFRSIQLDRSTPYTKEEIVEFAKDQALDTTAEFQRRWILHSGRTYYFFVGGSYVRRSQEEALNSAHELLLPARLNMYRDTQNGPVPLKLNELVKKYGSVIDQVYVDLTAQKTHYDWRRKTLIEAPCPFRDIEPKYNPHIEKWWRLMINDDELHERFLDWIASVPRIEYPACALLLYGPARSGKSLLPAKLARIWRQYGGPTELESLASDFNQEMQECPLVFGDEFVPTDHHGEPKTALLRKIIQDHDRTLKRKHIADAKLLGAIRLVIASNDPDLIVTSRKSLTNNDIEAINERFLCVRTSRKAVEYLHDLKKDHGDDPEVQEIFQGDAIPQHVWWMHENREVAANDRLIVRGFENSELGLRLMVSAGLRSAICHWLTNYIVASDEKRNFGAKGKRPLLHETANNETYLLVSAHMLHKLWSNFNDDDEKPSINALQKALGGVCDRRLQKRIDGEQHNFRTVNILRVKYWAATNDHTNPDRFDTCLTKLGLSIPYLDPEYLIEDD